MRITAFSFLQGVEKAAFLCYIEPKPANVTDGDRMTHKIGGTVVTKQDVSIALEELGVVRGDVLLVHSSFKSLGSVDGGADAVIGGMEAVLGEEGTLVMPTLCQNDFYNCYKTWHMDKPSEVGFLTEYFRKLPGVLRSDHATHSVAARGKLAHELTFEHTARGIHLCPFGETAFCDSSPWLKMYGLGTKALFIGVDTRKNTMKHTVESRYAEYMLSLVKDDAVREELRSQVATFGHYNGTQVWPLYTGANMHPEYEKLGIIRHARCGEAELMLIDVKEACDAAYEIISADPEKWFNEATLDWIARCRAAVK